MRPIQLYKLLLRRHGPQGWWPIFIENKPKVPLAPRQAHRLKFEHGLGYGVSYRHLALYRTSWRDPYFEIALGAILTQNTAWRNVAVAIRNLYQARALTPKKILQLSAFELQRLIRPTGYFRQKASAVRGFTQWLADEYRGDMRRLQRHPTKDIRAQLLDVRGIGPETADSILLYALNKAVFVIDAYTRRLCLQHSLAYKTYDEYQSYFTARLPRSARLFREYHALIIASGKKSL